MPKRNRHDRRDGTFIPLPPGERSMFPYVMSSRCDSTVYFEVDVPVDKLLLFLRKKKEEGVNISMFAFILVCLARTFSERPQINRFLMGRRLYQRNDTIFSFMVKQAMSDDSHDIDARFVVDPEKDPSQLLEAVAETIEDARGRDEDDPVIRAVMTMPRVLLLGLFKFLNWLDFFGLFPMFLAKLDPMRCSLFVSNLGSIGLDSAFHHLYEWGTCSAFLTIGRIRRRPNCQPDGSVISKSMCSFKFTVDERIAAGYYIARSLDIFKRYVSNPELLFPD